MKGEFDRFKLLWGALLLAAWAAVALILIRSGGKLTLAQLLSYEPENPIAAILVMLGLFLLKSVDFLMHSGLLYAADGVMFPLFGALGLNLLGALILTIPGYCLGRSLGGPAVAYVEGRYVLNTKTKKFHLTNCPSTLTIEDKVYYFSHN